MTTDYLAVCDNLSAIATTDAYKRMCQEALAGRHPEWKVWIRPAFVKENKVTPATPYIGAEPLNAEWRALKDLTIHGGMSGNQMHNAVRFALRDKAPLWAVRFTPDCEKFLEPLEDEGHEAEAQADREGYSIHGDSDQS